MRLVALMNTADAARELAISARTLSRWAKDGYVKPAFTTRAGTYRWDLADLRRQLAEQQNEESAGPPFAGELADAPRHPDEPPT